MSKERVRTGFWSTEEDEILKAYVLKNGLIDIKEKTGLNRSEKSCRNRWRMHIEPLLNKVPGRSSPEIRRQQQVYVSQAPGSCDTTRKNSILAPTSGSPQLPIVYPNPDKNSIAQVPSLTGINNEQSSSSTGLSSDVSITPLNEQMESDSADEDSLYGSVKRFLKSA